MLNTNSEHYKLLARFFGNNSGVRVEFKDGATPATDGKRIILPSELNSKAATLALAALLHEGEHIARTDFTLAEREHLTPAVFNCLNVLEDIRIDAATRTTYPNAAELQRAFLRDVIKRSGDAMKTEQPAQQLLKAQILRASGINAADVYGADVDKIAARLDTFADRAKIATSTDALLDDARLLAKTLMADQPQDDKQSGNGSGQQQNGAADKQQAADGQQDTDQQTNGEQTDQQTQADGSGADSKQNAGGNSYNKAADAKDKAAADRKQATADRQAADAEQMAARDEYKTERRKARLYTTKQRNAERDERDAQADGDAAAAAAAKDKADKYKDKADKHSAASTAAYNKYNAANDKRRAAGNKNYDAEQTEREAAAVMAELERCAFGGDDYGIELGGFKAIDADALADSSNAPAIEGSATLDDIIKDALIVKQDTDHADDGGSKINTARLATLAAGIDADDVFITTDDADHKTRVAFIIDGSGSMAHYQTADGSRYNDTRATLAVNAAAALLDALNKAINNGAPADFDVYVFGANVLKLIDGADEYTRDAFINKYNYARLGKDGNGGELDSGSSNLLAAVNTAAAELKDKAQDGARVIIIITDAEVNAAELKELRNGALLDGERVLFIGANVNTDRNADAAAIFGDYNLKDAASALDIISRALLAAV